jgi:hypothetical protein
MAGAANAEAMIIGRTFVSMMWAPRAFLGNLEKLKQPAIAGIFGVNSTESNREQNGIIGGQIRGACPAMINFRGPLTSPTLCRSAAGSLRIATRRCSAWPRCRPGPPKNPEGVGRRICPRDFNRSANLSFNGRPIFPPSNSQATIYFTYREEDLPARATDSREVSSSSNSTGLPWTRAGTSHVG